MAIFDYISRVVSGFFSRGRNGYKIKFIVLHDTSGPGDTNDISLAQAEYREQATINWFCTGKASIHYLIGPEITGAKVYQFIAEENTAYHAAGEPPRNTYVAPDGQRFAGSDGGTCSLANRGSIGIERFGYPGERVGLRQRNALIALVVDIARRHSLKPEQIISHQFLQTDRSDGETLLSECRAAVAAMWATTPAKLPYDFRFTPENFLYCEQTGYTIGGAILDCFIRLGKAFNPPTLTEYPKRIMDAVFLFGLPVGAEVRDDKTGKITQKFQNVTFVYDPSQPEGWITRPASIN